MTADSNIEKIKKIRNLTQAGYALCQASLKEANGDMEKALEILKLKGIEKAEKRSGNDSNASIIVTKISQDLKSIVMMHFIAETDFVTQNQDFGKFINYCAEQFINSDNDADVLINFEAFSIVNSTFEEALKIISGRYGENIKAKSIYKCKINNNNYIYTYLHNRSFVENLSAIAVFIESNVQHEIVYKLAIHASWSKPLVIYEKDLEGKEYDKSLSIEELVLSKQEISYNGKNVKIENLLKEYGIQLYNYNVFAA